MWPAELELLCELTALFAVLAVVLVPVDAVVWTCSLEAFCSAFFLSAFSLASDGIFNVKPA